LAARLVAGMDLGSTSMKLLVCDEDGAELLVEEVPTPWRAGPGGAADLPADCLVAAVGQLLAGASRELAARTDARVTALAIAGMGETGMVVDEGGTPVAPAFAWFDPRGAAQVAAFPAEVRAQFAGRTGLPLGPQASVAKLAYLREQGYDWDEALVRRSVPVVQEKIATLAEYPGFAGFLFQDVEPDPALLDARVLAEAERAIEEAEPFTADAIEQGLRSVAERLELKPREAFQPIRVAVTGSKISPGLFESIELLGREQSLARIRRAREASA